MRDFLAQRAVAGVEAVSAGSYCRTTATGTVHVAFDPAGPALDVTSTGDAADTLARVRHVFDPDGTGLVAARAHLAADPHLARLLDRRPGLRLPASWDPFEAAMRAVLGQQVTVGAARRLAGQLAAITHVPSGDANLPLRFPDAAAVAVAGLAAIGMPAARRRTLHAIAHAALHDPALLRLPHGPHHAARLLAVPGIGPWSAHYILLRGFRDPDAFPASDVALLRALADSGVRPGPADLLRRAEAWRPWRAYAAQLLWTADASVKETPPP